MALPGSTHSTAAALKEDMPGFCFDNYARNASLPLEKKMQMPTVCLFGVWMAADQEGMLDVLFFFVTF